MQRWGVRFQEALALLLAVSILPRVVLSVTKDKFIPVDFSEDGVLLFVQPNSEFPPDDKSVEEYVQVSYQKPSIL